MRVYIDTKLENQLQQAGIRTHPWFSGESPGIRYYDFKSQPDLIPNVLEDFSTWTAFESTQEFFAFVAALNGAGSMFETNDCAFRGPHTNPTPAQPFPLQADGRLMMFYRELELNLSEEHTTWLQGAIRHYLEQVDSTWEKGLISLAFAPTVFSEVPQMSEGRQLVMSWWVWGEDEVDVMEQFGVIVKYVRDAVSAVEQEITDASP